MQIFIAVATVIAFILWLRHGINKLDAKIEGVIDSYAGIRETLGWIRGRIGFMEQS